MSSLRARLLVSLALLATVILGLILSGWSSLSVSNEALQSVYNDRVVPLRQLKVVSDMYAVNVVDASHKVRGGAFTWDQGIASVNEAQTKIRKEWETYLGTFLIEGERKLIGEAKPLMAEADRSIAKLLAIFRSKDQAALDTYVTKELYPIIDPLTERIGLLVDLQIDIARQEFERSQAAFLTSKLIMSGGAAFGLLVFLFAAFVVVRRVLAPLRAMTGAMSAIASGDLGADVPCLDRGDEIGAIAQAVVVFKENGVARQRLESEQAAEREVRERRAKALEELVLRFNQTVQGLVESVGSAAHRMEGTAGSMSTTAEQTNRQAMIVASAAEEASVNVQTVASSAEELAASIAEIGRQVAQSARIAGQAADEAARTNTLIDGLAGAAQKIGEVVNLINDIASQTNLLALNATIEAARAGEAGKGFAVVASEVKNLANQTAKATDEIGQQIGAVQGATREAVEAIRGIGGIITDINEIAATVAAAVEEQGAATQEIARNVEQAAVGTGEVSSNIAGVTQAAGVAGQTAKDVLGAAGQLSREAHTLRQEVARFIDAVRAV